ncbi:MAG: hypothetical protein KGS44_05345 [Alphaproteobacteria bacterium]|nr:hypothetical protein [Alphaproteobacteria bacterium]
MSIASCTPARSETPLKQHKNLILLRGGDRSYHPTFFSGFEAGEGPNWDLHISYFGETAPYLSQAMACSWTMDGGKGKFGSIHRLIEGRNLDLAHYDYIACPDDDLIITGPQWNTLFDLVRRFDLEVGGVSLNPFGYWEFNYMLSQPGLLLRYTNQIEPFALVFRRDMFKTVFPYMRMKGVDWGIEHIVGHLCTHPKGLAVIDAVDVFHTRMQRTGELYGGMKNVDEVFLGEAVALHQRLGVVRRPPQILGAVDKNGRDVNPRDFYRTIRPALRALRKWRGLRKVTSLSEIDEGRVVLRAPYPMRYRGARISPSLRKADPIISGAPVASPPSKVG